MEYYEKLKELRVQHNMSQEQLAEQLHVTRQTISKWEQGINQPDIETLKKYSTIFNVSLDELTGNEISINEKVTPLSTATDSSERTAQENEFHVKLLKKNKITLLVLFLINLIGPLIYLMLTALWTALNYNLEKYSLIEWLRNGLFTYLLLISFISTWSVPALTSIIFANRLLNRRLRDGTIRINLTNKNSTALYFVYLGISIAIGLIFVTTSFVSRLLATLIVFGYDEMATNGIAQACLTTYTLGITTILFTQSFTCMFALATRKPTLSNILTPILSVTSPIIMLLICAFLNNELGIYIESNQMPLFNVTVFNPMNVDGKLVLYIAISYLSFAIFFVVCGWLSFVKGSKKIKNSTYS